MKTPKINKRLNPYGSFGRDILYITPKRVPNQREISYTPYLESFNDFVLQDGYPCIGAKTAVNGNTYAIGLFDKMNCWRTAKELAYGLTEYLEEMVKRPSNFMTYIAIFKYDHYECEKSYEDALWGLLRKLIGVDSENHSWSKKVGANPSKSDFSFSFGGRGFYLVGMHPESSRKARRFKYPSIAFNLHGQFENLREKGRYERIKKVVRKNEIEFSGSINPMLADFGKGLEAPQYSGRQVGADWKCPFTN